MTIDEMQWILELLQTKNMSRAAQNLFITQPALSQCVNRIEKQLGFRLFVRTNKGMIPTEKGKLFQVTAQQITGIYRQFLIQAELLDTIELDEITIGMAPFLSSCCSATLLKTLGEHFPNKKFQVYDANTVHLLDALRNGRCQIVVTDKNVAPEEMAARPFAKFPCGIFLRKGSPIAEHIYEHNGKRFLDPKYLKDEPMCLTCPGQASRKKSELILSEAGVVPPIILESSHITTLYRYAQAGLASALCPITGEATSVDQGNDESLICFVPENYSNAYSHLVMIYSTDIGKRVPQKVFDCISECILSCPSFASTIPLTVYGARNHKLE